MHFEFALIPVLAGYWILKRTHLFRHAYEQQTHYRVFFEPAITGAVLFVVAWLVAWMFKNFFKCEGSLVCVGAVWRSIVPFNHADALALTVLLAIVIPHIVNQLVGKQEAANRWALKNETPRGKILRESLEQAAVVEVSLANGQSYVGFVENEPPDFEGDVSLSPELSGYRDSETHRLVVTTEYEEQDDDFRVVLLLDEMTSVSHFDPESPYIRWKIP